MAKHAEFNGTDQDTDGTTNGDLLYCEVCKSYIHYTYTKTSPTNFFEFFHRGHSMD